MRRKRKDLTTHFSLVSKLKSDGKTNDEFEIMLNNLSLEELIGLKLELSSKFLAHGKMFGFPLWNVFPKIVMDALLKFTYNIAPSRFEAARFLGLSERFYFKLLDEFKIKEYFKRN